MGKKSKRNRSNKSDSQQQQQRQQQEDGNDRVAPNKRNEAAVAEEEETLENLRFQDPFVDEYIVEDANADDDDDADADGDEKMVPVETMAGVKNKNNTDNNNIEMIQSWHPLMGENVHHIELEMDPSAYKMYHTLSPEWPSLSFDFLKDDLGNARQRFPHSLQAVIGTQAGTDNDDDSDDDGDDNVANANQLTVLQLSDLSKMPQENEDDEDDLLDDSDDDDSDSDDDEEDLDLDPILEHYHLPHYGGVNRIRAMPQNSNIVATWSDVGNVYLYNIEHVRARFLQRGNNNNNMSSSHNNNNSNSNKPFFTYSGHGIEGFAMDWSLVNTGHFATGDNHGSIHLWKPNEGGSSTSTSYEVVKAYESGNGSNSSSSSSSSLCQISVEDIQWSPTEGTVLCAAESGGHISIYDTRAPNRYMLRQNVVESKDVDVNVISWNRLVSNLLATGADDGTLAVWDLRQFQSSSSSSSSVSSAPKPLARFTCHQTPITSVEWHPTDESMLAVSDTVGAYVYDLSVEEDTAANTSTTTTTLVADIPSQLLFCHSGSQDFKELHWHPQISSCIMTTAYSGFSIFIPSNL